MHKNWKKTMAGMLGVCLITTCVPGVSEFGNYVETTKAVQAATTKKAVSGKCGKKATWKYNTKTKTLTIGGSGAMYDYLNYYYDEDDEIIDTAPWKDYRAQIKKVVVGDKVTTIGEEAFSDCSALKQVKLGKNIKKIKGNAFQEASNLKKINFGEKLEVIGDYAFYNCAVLEDVYVGKSLKQLSYSAFGGCTGIKKLKVHSKNKYFTMEKNGLLNKKKTEWILGCFATDTTCYIGNSVNDLNFSLLNVHTGIENFSVSSKNKMFSSEDGLLYSKDKKILYMCPKGKKGTVKVSDSTIEMYMDEEENDDDYNYAEYIDEKKDAFEGCTNLEGVILGKNIKFIDGNFEGCNKLKKLEISKENEYYASENGGILSKDKDILYYCVVVDEGTFVVPESVSEIEGSAFLYRAADLEKIVFSDAVRDYNGGLGDAKSITFGKNYYNEGDVSWLTYEYNPFKIENIYVSEKNPYYSSVDGVLYNKEQTELLACPKQKKICNMPDTVTNVNENALKDYDTQLEELYISDGITEMTKWVKGENLKKIQIGKNVKEIALADITLRNLEQITVSEENQTYKLQDHMLYTKDGSKLIWCPAKKSGTVTICDGTSSIGGYAFGYAKKITQINIPATVKTIEPKAFYGLAKKTVFYVPAGTKEFYKSLLTKETGFASGMTIKEME